MDEFDCHLPLPQYKTNKQPRRLFEAPTSTVHHFPIEDAGEVRDEVITMEGLHLSTRPALPSSVPAEVAAPSKRGPSAFILALLTELSSVSPLREKFTLLPLAQASGRYERPSAFSLLRIFPLLL
jgi:hypothetical protein